MNLLLTSHISGYPDLLARFASRVYVVDRSFRSRVTATDKVFAIEDGPRGNEQIKTLFEAGGIDCIYVQGWSDLLRVRRLQQAAGSTIPILSTAHSSYMLRTRSKAFMYFCAMRAFTNGFIFLASGLEHRWSWLTKRIGLRTWTIPNPVDTTRFYPADWQVVKDHRLLGYVGVVSPMKGQHTAINAIAELRRRGRDFRLELVGDVLDDDYLRSLQQLVRRESLDGFVSFTGRIPHSMIPERMRSWNCYLCPSVSELMPVNVLEAMASGLPVVGSKIWGVEDAVVERVNGLVFPEGDSRAMAAAIEHVTGGGVRSEMARAARARALAVFDTQIVADQLQVVFNSLITRPPILQPTTFR